MKKKLLAVLLSTVLAAGALVGCGSSSSSSSSADSETTTEETSDEATEEAAEETTTTSSSSDEVVTLSLYIPTLATYSESMITEVEEVLSEYTTETYGWAVDLVLIEMGNFESSINLAMTTDEVDVTCYFTSDGQLSTYVHNGQLLDITDYYENAEGEIKEVFTDSEMSASSLDGSLWGFVRKYQYGGYETVIMNAEIVEEMGIDAASITTMDELEEVLYEVHEAYPDIYTMVPQSTSEMTWCVEWVAGIGLSNFAYTNDVDSTEVGSIFELDSFAEFCSYTNKWYNDGLIMPDAISNTQEGSSMISAGSAFAAFHNADIDPLETIYSNVVTTGILVDAKANPTDIGNLQYGISANSAHPDEAFELLCAMYTDETLAKYIAYGIEGESYVINDDGKAEYPEGMTDETEPWGGFSATACYANYLILPVKASAIYEDAQETVDEFQETVATSPAIGFYFDTTDYADFITAYTNLEDKYKDALMTGSIALDDVLPSIQSELEEIGFYDVLAELQTELDEFLAE